MINSHFHTKVSELGPDRPASVLYGITPDNQYIPVRLDPDGRIETSATGGSTFSFFADNSTLDLNSSSFKVLSFGFTSSSICVFNNSPEPSVLKFSFDGSTTHGVLQAGQSINMLGRTQSEIWLAGISLNFIVTVW